jgi:RNA polymerase sigma-70 factor (ECF subfamily)
MTVMPPPGCPAADPATEAFRRHRELLFAVAYNMLGSVADTEDVLQETWLGWSRRAAAPGGEPAGSPRSCLVRAAMRHALARQDAIRRRRAAYLGPWLPDPLVSPLDPAPAAGDGATVRGEPLSLPVLVILEALAPLERAAFVLQEVSGYPGPEIAPILGRGPGAVRELARRAGARVQAGRPPRPASPRNRQQVTARFAAAMLGGDVAAFRALLAPEVTAWTDSGGKARCPGLREGQDREQVARLLAAGSFRPRRDLEVRYRRVNGDRSVVLLAEGAPFAVLVFDLAPGGGQVTGIYAVTNPDKLPRVS